MSLIGSITAVGPELGVIALALFVLVFDLIWGEREKILSWISVVVLAGILAWVALLPKYGIFKQIILAGTALVILISVVYMHQFKWRAEFISLLLIACSGMMMVASANELITLYVSLEVATISLFILTAFKKEDLLSTEAGLKIYVQGFASSAVLVYGLSLIYGLTGSTYLSVIATRVASIGFSSPILVLAVTLVIVGVGFKLSFVPFHMWVPDVYQGAPTPITAFFSVVSKAAGLIVFIRVLFVPFQALHTNLAVLFGALAIVTMTLGNLIAIPQKNIKRLLAYSTIAHVGYLLVGVAMWNAVGLSSLIFYFIAYAFANLLAFAVVIAFYNSSHSHHISDYAGLFSRNPLLAIGMAIALLSLGGIPPLAGFIGKFYLFSSAVSEGYLLLAGAGVVNTLISMSYYLNVIRQMFWGRPDRRHGPIKIGFPLKLALYICIALVLFIGIYPAPFLKAVEYAASFMF